MLTQQFHQPGQTYDRSLADFPIAFFLGDPLGKICIVYKNLCTNRQLFRALVNEFEVLKDPLNQKIKLIGHQSDDS